MLVQARQRYAFTCSLMFMPDLQSHDVYGKNTLSAICAVTNDIIEKKGKTKHKVRNNM